MAKFWEYLKKNVAIGKNYLHFAFFSFISLDPDPRFTRFSTIDALFIDKPYANCVNVTFWSADSIVPFVCLHKMSHRYSIKLKNDDVRVAQWITDWILDSKKCRASEASVSGSYINEVGLCWSHRD